MQPVEELRRMVGMTQAALARSAGTSQPTIAAYESGAKSPTLSTLERLAASVGLELDVSFVPPLTREDRRSLELHRAIAAKLAGDPATTLRRARKNLRRMAAEQPGAAPLLREWRLALARPLGELVRLLTDASPRARDLRQVTPFAGVLSPRERWTVYRRFRSMEERSS